MTMSDERDKLARAIAEAASTAGLIDGSMPLDGPQLLMLCNDLATEITRLRAALLRTARFSHAKDFSHHGVTFEECDKQSCAEARREVGASGNQTAHVSAEAKWDDGIWIQDQKEKDTKSAAEN